MLGWLRQPNSTKPYPPFLYRYLARRPFSCDEFVSDPMSPDRYAAPAIVRSDVFVPMNVEAREDGFVITAFIPGITTEDLQIHVLEDTVTLRGELKVEGEDVENRRFLLHEIPRGSFTRAIRLPAPLDPEHAEATIEKGVLTLRIPKAEEARPKTIIVNVK